MAGREAHINLDVNISGDSVLLVEIKKLLETQVPLKGTIHKLSLADTPPRKEIAAQGVSETYGERLQRCVSLRRRLEGELSMSLC